MYTRHIRSYTTTVPATSFAGPNTMATPPRAVLRQCHRHQVLDESAKDHKQLIEKMSKEGGLEGQCAAGI